MTPPVTVSKTKLFLSYGRRDAEKVAKRLKTDLENCGYEVWMDLNRLTVGSVWTQEIQEAIQASQAVVALLSPHSVRVTGVNGSIDDSICLNELAYARQNARRFVPVMVDRCEPPFILCHLHYLELLTWEDETEYQRGLQALREHIEATIRNEIRFRSWTKTLEPIEFAPFLDERRRGFVGRHWLFSEVDAWLGDLEHEERCLLVKGDPGVGKSAFVAQWVLLNPGGRLLAYHCCQSDQEHTVRPDSFVRSIAAMIASRLPAYEALLKEPGVANVLSREYCGEDPAGAFNAGIVAPLHRIEPPGGLRCILVDALDEAVLTPRGTLIVDLLASQLDRMPKWLRVVATTRKEPEVLRKLERLRAKSLEADDPRNQNDARDYLLGQFTRRGLAELLERQGAPREEAVGMLLDRSKGNFLYLRFALDGLAIGAYSLDRPDDFPPGLSGFFQKAFESKFATQAEYAPVAGVLAAVLAAREPLGGDLLLAASGFASRSELRAVLRRLSAYVPEREGTYGLFHRSMAEWLRDSLNNESYCVEVSQGERRLADVGWAEYERQKAALSPYMLRHLPHHLAATGQLERLAQFLSDVGVLDAAWEARLEHEWMQGWRRLKGQLDPAVAYQRSLEAMLAVGGDPRRVAAVTRKVGALMRLLGLHGHALPFAERSLELVRQSGTRDPAALASSLLDLAEACRLLCEWNRAEAAYDEALWLREQLGPETEETGQLLNALCVFHNSCERRDVEKAIQFNERAIRIFQKLQPRNSAALADAINDKGILLEAMDQEEKALGWYEKARVVFEEAFPDGHPELGVTLTNIARWYSRHDRTEEAAALACAGLEMRARFVVPHDGKCQGTRRELAGYCLALGRMEESVRWAREVLSCGSGDPAGDVVRHLRDLGDLAAILALSGNPLGREEALGAFRQVLAEVPTPRLGQAWEVMGELFMALVRVELNQARLGDALTLFWRGWDEMIGASAPPWGALAGYAKQMAEVAALLELSDLKRDLTVRQTEMELRATNRLPLVQKLEEADRQLKAGDLEKCRHLAEEVFQAVAADPSADEPWKNRVAESANLLALYAKNVRNAFDLAEWLYERAYALNPKNSNIVGNIAFFLTSVRGRHDEAAELYEEAIALDHGDANALSNYAVFHAHVRRDYEKAESLFEQARQVESPHADSILGNYAALKIIRGDLPGAMLFARQARELCLGSPSRLIARPIFCAAAIAALEGRDMTPYLAQLKSLFLMGVPRAPWQAQALLELLRTRLPEEPFALLEAAWKAICSHTEEGALERFPTWAQARPMPLDKPWRD